MTRIYKVAVIGTSYVTVEEAEDARAACWAAGWPPEWCETVDITDAVKVLRQNGELQAA